MTYDPLRHKGVEQKKHAKWVQLTLFWMFVTWFLVGICSYPASILIERGFSQANLDWAWVYFKTLPTHFKHWTRVYGDWVAYNVQHNHFPPAGLLVTIFSGLAVLTFGLLSNPHSAEPQHMGDGRVARKDDIKKMGLLKGWLVVLGEWKGKMLMLPETLSVLCVAPPGTGKTVGIVVPTILSCDNISMIINDVKPELADITSGYRSTLSTVVRLEWSAEDRPEDGVFYPRWNPLSPKAMPRPGAQRDMYVDRLVNVIIEDPKGDADPHWTKKGRAALTGLIHYVASKCEAGHYDGFPPEWYGEEPSLPMLLDWVTEATLDAADEIEKMRQQDPNSVLFADPIKNFLMHAVKEAREHQYSPRAVLELTQLANTPDKERGSILSTMDAGLTIFKNAAVRARTSKSDFAFEDVRGIKDPETGKVQPMTVYLCVNSEDAKALGPITGMFVETLSAWLTNNPPGKTKADGGKIGPYPALFVLDEFPQMPKLQALIDGPAVGRGQKISYLLIGQDLGQISAVYGKDQLETILSTTAAKIVLPLNNEQTAERFSKMMGRQTVKQYSDSRSEGLTKQVNPFAVSRSYSFIDDSVKSVQGLMSIPKGEHVLIWQGFAKYPIECKTPWYFAHPKFKKLVNPANGGRYESAPPMPYWMVERRLMEEGYIEVPSDEADVGQTITDEVVG